MSSGTTDTDFLFTSIILTLSKDHNRQDIKRTSSWNRQGKGVLKYFERAKVIRDEKDIPILAAAMASKVDYLITGDPYFHTEESKNC